jgi:hypothetical protein
LFFFFFSHFIFSFLFNYAFFFFFSPVSVFGKHRNRESFVFHVFYSAIMKTRASIQRFRALPKRLARRQSSKTHLFALWAYFSVLSSQSNCLSPHAKKENSLALLSRTVQAAMSDDDTDPDYLVFLQDYERFAVNAPRGENEDEDAEEEEEEEEEGETEAEEDGEDEEYVLESPRVEEGGHKRRRTEGGEACWSNGVGSAEGSQGNEWNRSEIEGLFCPICMEAWTSDGGHHIWCQCLLFLAFISHVYEFSEP